MNNHFYKIIIILSSIIVVLFFSTLIPVPNSRLNLNSITSTKIYDRYGVLLRHVLSSENGTACKINIHHIPDYVKDIFIITEDKRFYNHSGVDKLAIGRAFFQNVRHKKIISGASTITQQLIRNIYRLPRNLPAKIYEVWLSLRLERTLSKAQILEHYLNRIPFGNQTFGIGAAAEFYFLKPVEDLTIAEAAFLAAIPKSPLYYNPIQFFDRTKERQAKILKLMRQNKLITGVDFQRIINQPIHLTREKKHFKAPHFTNQIIKRYLNNGERPSEIYTTIDYNYQENIEYFIVGRLQELVSRNVHNAAVLVLKNDTGEILTWIGSQDFFDEQFSGQVDGVVALRQPGSALKPFTYGLALQLDYTAATVIPDIETHAAEIGGYYTPQNYDETYHGPVTIRRALACSYNVPPIRILENIGEARLLEVLHEAGFYSLNKSPQYYGKGLTLGNGEVTLLELVRAYAAIANGGVLIQEKFTQRVFYPSGELADYSNHSDTIGVVFDRNINAILVDILSDNDARIPAFGKYNPLAFPFPCAAKTGTSKDYRDNWAIGCTPEVTVGVWVGNFSGDPMHRISGISGAGFLLNDVLFFLNKYMQFSAFDVPENLISIKICPLSGRLAGSFCPETKRELFRSFNIPKDTCDWHRVVAIDSRNGKLATKQTEPQFVLHKLFVDLPPIYLPWMIEHNIPLIPKDSTDLKQDIHNQ